MATATQQRLIGWPGSPVYTRPLAAPRRAISAHWMAFALIILFGAALRFFMLDQPAIWGDEAATFGRTSGTFVQLCDILRNDGFAPLHYELIWWLHNHFILTPFMLRLAPAIAGTLTVPVMYFLGRMLSTRRVALWAALFTACSAWLLNYSRDAKMYSEFWLFCTLNYACLIWWFRNKSGIAWWCFVVSGIAMVGLDALGFIVIGIGIIWFLTQARVHWLSTLAYVLALGIIVLGPGVYYHYFNDWHRDQLNWIDYTQNQSTGELSLQLISSFLFKYQFVGETVRYAGSDNELAPRIAAIALSVIAAMALLGALPWRKARRANAPGIPEDISPTAWWRVLFWLLAATAVPVYGWYCASTLDFATPWNWAAATNQLMGGYWAWMIILAVVVAAICMASREIAATLAMLLLIVMAVLVGAALERGGWSDPATILGALETLLCQAWFNVGCTGIALGLIWNYCAPAGFIRARSIATFFGTVLLTVAAIAAITAIAILAFYAATNHQTFSPKDLLHVWLAKLLNPVVLLLAVIVPLCVAAYRGSVDLRWRLKRWVVFAAVIAGILLLCQGITMLLGHPVQSLWVPRYLGMVWMPMAIGLVILIARLPTRGLRAAGMIVLIAVNLFSFGLRVLADNEPPVDKVVADISNARFHPEKVHTIVAIAHSNYGPGGGGLNTHVGAYYLELDRLKHGLAPIPPAEFYYDAGVQLEDFDADLSAARINQVLQQQPKITEFIIWTSHDMDDNPPGDDIQPLLGPAWHLVHDNRWTARDHWTWKNFYYTRRRVYRKI